MFKRLSLIIVTLALALFVANSAQAATLTPGPLTITYEGEGAIFSQLNLGPGDITNREIQVTNNGKVPHNLAIATKNISGELANNIHITPIISGVSIWTLSLEELSDQSSESKTITALNTGETKAITLQASFAGSNNNTTQNKSVNFDIVFGTEETEPFDLNAQGRVATLSPLASPTITKEASSSPTASSDNPIVKGEQTGDEKNVNPYLLILVPVAAIIATVLAPEFLFAAGATAVGAGVTAVLGASSDGPMPFGLFELIIGAEIITLLIASYFLLHHDNRASRKIRGHKHRLRIR